MTAAHLPINTGGLFGTSTDRGFSPDAAAIRDQLQRIILGFYDSFYIRGLHQGAHRALQEVFTEASSENWDGYGSRKVSAKTFENALSFLHSLPSGVPSPEVAAEPDGEIGFEWHTGHGRVFSISVGDGDTVSFAGLSGRRKIHGTEIVFDEIPRTLLQHLGQTLAE